MNKPYLLHTDGGARGNPGPAGIGVVLQAPNGDVLEEIGRGIGWATNNVAEYEGLIAGLEAARKHGAAELEVFMDSTLVVEQMKGSYRVKNPGLRSLHAKARSLARQFDKITFTAVPRARNKEADRLSNQGMDAQAAEVSPGEPDSGPVQNELS
jgi:ribonuclease HI